MNRVSRAVTLVSAMAVVCTLTGTVANAAQPDLGSGPKTDVEKVKSQSAPSSKPDQTGGSGVDQLQLDPVAKEKETPQVAQPAKPPVLTTEKTIPLTSTDQPVNVQESAKQLTVKSATPDQIWQQVQKYLVGQGKVKFFNEAAARADNVGEDVIAAGRMFNEFVLAEDKSFRSVRLPLWGNWCGPGYGGENGAPVDELDIACMHHDLCYDQQGYFSCDCDQAFIDEIDRRWPRMKEKERIAAVAAKGFFTLGKLWCKKPIKVQKDAFRLEMKQNAWVVARYDISWDEETTDSNGKINTVHKTWQSNNLDRTLSVVDQIDLPSNAKNLNVKISTHTGLFWRPWKTVMENTNLDLVKHRVLELKGTAFRIWVQNQELAQ